MTRITLKFAVNSMPYHYLTEYGYYVFSEYIRFTEYKTNKEISIPWSNIAVIDDSYEENK